MRRRSRSRRMYEIRIRNASRTLTTIRNDANGAMIICFYRQAVSILIEQSDLEIDMSYKRIRQANMNEILFTRFLKAHNKSMYFRHVCDAYLTYISIYLRSDHRLN